MAAIDWSAITITDDVMFGTVFTKPNLCRRLLERLLDIPIERVEMVERERAIVPELGARGIRMDVYAKDGSGRVFNVEMQKVNEGNLMKRSRYYLSANDMDCIAPSQDFNKLRDSFVIFICLFDPFEQGLARYTVRPHCIETGSEVPDGASRLFVNAIAYDACEDARLASFLRYLVTGRIDGDEFCIDVDGEVRRTRDLPDWRATRMRFDVYLHDKERAAERRGIERGMKQGLEQGVRQGIAENRELMARIASALREAGRENELTDALLDPEIFQQLLDEFGIASDAEEADPSEE